MAPRISALTFPGFALLVLLLSSIAKDVAAFSFTHLDPETGKPTCEIEGDADLYGLGVRLGVYFQWLGSYIANILLPGEISANLDTNSVFLLAIFLAVVRGTFNLNVHSLDALLLLELGYGYFFSVFSVFGFRIRPGKDGKAVSVSTLGVYVRIAIVTALACYGLWFWFMGITELELPECDEVIFFFGKLDALKGIRTFYQIASVLCLLYYGTMAVLAITTVTRYLIIRPLFETSKTPINLRFWDQFLEKITDHPKMPLKQEGVKLLFRGIRVFNLIWILWSAITIEMTLNWNHVTGTVGGAALSSTGQQLPTIIGVATFLRVLLMLWRMWRKDKAGGNGDTEAIVTPPAKSSLRE